MKKAGLTALSDAPGKKAEKTVYELGKYLKSLGIETVCAEHVFSDRMKLESVKKTKELERMMKNPGISMILDISGGDSANLTLPFIDFTTFEKPFFGYSDLTCVLNAAASAGCSDLYLFQIRNALKSERGREAFEYWLENGKVGKFSAVTLRGKMPESEIMGGNIRCFMKLMGTGFMPDLRGKILFLEARSGDYLRMRTMIEQLDQAGITGVVSGLIIGQTTELEKEGERDRLIDDILKISQCPLAVTDDIGHSYDSLILQIGKEIEVK